ncbi:MAG: cytochrome P460 family protein [Gammaproteobacteria bacterium]
MKIPIALACVFACVVPASGQADGAATTPIYGISLPAGYRDWKLITVARVGGERNDLRAKLGNDIAIEAYREGKRPFPDGTIITRLAWTQAPAAESYKGPTTEALKKLLGESFVSGPATNVQFMVKDSKKYASTGGWGFAQFNDGKPADEAVHKTCFGCHEPARDLDFVFTRYSP